MPRGKRALVGGGGPPVPGLILLEGLLGGSNALRSLNLGAGIQAGMSGIYEKVLGVRVSCG